MSRSMFGWSYPPGCSGTPFDEDYPCQICGKAVDDCDCPTCPVCDVAGDPFCYEKHGMTYSPKQLAAQEKLKVDQKAQYEAEKAWCEQEQKLQAE